MIKFADTIEDLMANPRDYGMPTFEEFVAHKERYRDRYDAFVASIDAGDHNTGAIQRYFIETKNGEKRVSSLEQAERIARDMGLSIHNMDDFKIDPQYQPGDTAGKHWLKVTFRPRKFYERGWFR